MNDCMDCDDCPFVGLKTPPDVHEIHVTISAPKQIKLFRQFCEDNGWKAIILDLATTKLDVMITTRYRGEENGALELSEGIVERSRDAGYHVLRRKIETSLTNPGATIAQNEDYFETHLSVKVDNDQQVRMLREIPFVKEVTHVSRNLFKENVIMITTRTYNEINLHHISKVHKLKNAVNQAGFRVNRVINEFCWFDSNQRHDKEWLNVENLLNKG